MVLLNLSKVRQQCRERVGAAAIVFVGKRTQVINPCLGPNRSSVSRGKTEPSGCEGWSINLLSISVPLTEVASSLFL